MMNGSSAVLLLLAWLIAPCAAQVEFTYAGGSCRKGHLSVSNEVMTCNNGNSCVVGDTLDASGTVAIQDDSFPSNYQVLVKPCLMFLSLWYICYDETLLSLNVCDYANLANAQNGNTCPSADTYSFDLSVPMSEDFFDSTFNSDIYMETQIVTSGDGSNGNYGEEGVDEQYEVYETCTFQFQANVADYSSYYDWSMSFVGVAALVSGAVLWKRRRRSLAVNNPQTHERSVDFVELTDRLPSEP